LAKTQEDLSDDNSIRRLYEGMFLVDSALAGSDWQGVNDAVKNILDRAGAEIVSAEKWDERKLAYEINGKSRGTYILTYFNADPANISGIERDVQLSEQIMRVLVLRAEAGAGAPSKEAEEPVAAATPVLEEPKAKDDASGKDKDEKK